MIGNYQSGSKSCNNRYSLYCVSKLSYKVKEYVDCHLKKTKKTSYNVIYKSNLVNLTYKL